MPIECGISTMDEEFNRASSKYISKSGKEPTTLQFSHDSQGFLTNADDLSQAHGAHVLSYLFGSDS